MAVNIWQGTTGDWSTAGNWSQSAVPIAGDEVIFDGNVSEAVTGGGEAANGIAFDFVHIKSSFSGNLGTASEPICIGTATGDNMVILFEGTGTLHLLCSAADALGTDGVIPKVIINSNGGTVYLYSQNNDATNTNTFSEVYLFQGTLYLDTPAASVCGGSVATDAAGAVVTDLHLYPKSNSQTNSTCTIDDAAYKVNGTVKTNVYMANGSITSDTGFNKFYMSAGVLYLGTASGGGTGVDIDDLKMQAGTLYWNPNEDGAYLVGHIFGGSLQCSTTTNIANTRVLGNGAGNDVYLYSGASMSFATGRGNVSISASSQLINLGGSIELDSGVDLSYSYNPDLS